MIFATLLAVPLAVGEWYLKRPSLDSGARAGLACSAWLGVVSVLALASAPPVDTWRLGTALAGLGIAGALVVGGASLVHVMVVRGFLRRIRRGEEPAYRI